MIIYKVTNLIDGKIYIGRTVNSLDERKSVHLSHAKSSKYNLAFHAALTKHGAENFKWEVIDREINFELLIELEEFYIKKYDCKVPNGYNMPVGRPRMEVSQKVVTYSHSIDPQLLRQIRLRAKHGKVSQWMNAILWEAINDRSAK